MVDLRADFKKWLVSVKQYKESTADSYIRRTNHIYNQTRPSNIKTTKTTSNIDQQWLSQHIIPILTAYYEFSNKEYYLDRVTICSAQEYLRQIVTSIYENTFLSLWLGAKLYIFDGKDDYFICDTTINKIPADIRKLNVYLYGNHTDTDEVGDSAIDPMKLVMLIQKLQNNPHIDDIRKLAIHIVYKQKDIQNSKNALSAYCNFLYYQNKETQYNIESNALIQLTQKENPNKTVDGNYKEVIPITGEHARQVTPNIKVKRETEVGFVYSIRDLAHIFDIDYYTAMDLMDRYGEEYKIETVLHDYYSADATNKCLEEYHHFKDKKIAEKYPVEYDNQGYHHWCTRKEAMKKLGIKKAAFYKYIYENCLYIDYAEKARKYYILEVEYFANTPEVKRIKNRKNNK